MFGFGKGKLELSLSKKDAAYGEVLSGTASLQLKEPQQARGFFVVLIAEKLTQRNYGDRIDQESVTLFEHRQALGGEGLYGTQPYSFSFQVNIPMQSQVPGIPTSTIGKLFSGKVKWHVIAKLDIPKGRDVSKKIEIKVK